MNSGNFDEPDGQQPGQERLSAGLELRGHLILDKHVGLIERSRYDAVLSLVRGEFFGNDYVGKACLCRCQNLESKVD